MSSLQLPKETLHIITKDFTQKDIAACARINRCFYTTLNPDLWTSPIIETDLMAERFLNSLNEIEKQQQRPYGQNNRPHPVRHLTLKTTSFWSDTTLIELIHHVKRTLESLVITRSLRITDKGIHQLAVHCTQLRSLTLNAKKVTDASITSLAQHCRHFTHLNVTTPIHSLSWKLFRCLAPCNATLERLEVAVDYLRDGGRRQSGWKHMLQDLTRLTNLTDLRLLHVSTFFIKDLVLQKQRWWWPKLKRLEIKEYMANDAYIQKWIRFYAGDSSLVDLTLAKLNLSNNVLVTVGQSLASSLTRLDVSGNPRMTAAGVRMLVSRCPLLTDLRLENCAIGLDAFPELSMLSGSDQVSEADAGARAHRRGGKRARRARRALRALRAGWAGGAGSAGGAGIVGGDVGAGAADAADAADGADADADTAGNGPVLKYLNERDLQRIRLANNNNNNNVTHQN